MERRTLAIAAAISAAVLAKPAGATSVAYPRGYFARPLEERAIVIWDEANKTEHLLRSLSVKGDAESFGVVLATPTLPSVAEQHDEPIDGLAKLFLPDGGVSPDAPRTQLGEYDAVTIRASDDKSLGDWLAKFQLVDKPSMRAWAKTYADKGWYLTAVRSTSKGTGDRTLDVPTVRLTFKTDAPVLPYSESAVDDADEAAYRNKYNPHQPYRGYSYGMRKLDVYVVAARQMQAMSGAVTAGPAVADAVRVTNATLGSALGDTKAWRFDPKSRPTWVVTHLSENVWQRAATGDLAFQTYDLPKARPGAGVTEVDDRPVGPTFPGSSMTWTPDPTSTSSGHKKLFRYGAIALLLFLVGAVGFAMASEADRKPKAKS